MNISSAAAAAKKGRNIQVIAARFYDPEDWLWFFDDLMNVEGDMAAVTL